MPSFNRVLLMANLTRDPQIKFLPSQMQVAEFGLACNRKFKTAAGEDREEVTFVDATAFGKQAELINQYFTKGKPIFIEGRLKYDQWDDKNGGGKRSKLTVVVENFQFVGGRDGAGGDDGGEYDQRPEKQGYGGRGQQRPGMRMANSGASRPPPDDSQAGDDDLPF